MTNLSIPLSRTKDFEQPWLSSAWFDGLLIISPALVSSAVAIIFRDQLSSSQPIPLWAWVSFVLLVDVAHVYATGFRTYFNRQAWQKHSFLLIAIPVICWTVGCLLYSIDGLIFWRALAYLAVFHFIRQQYGFIALYSRKDPEPFAKYRWVDGLCIYAATIYPLLFWHTHLPRNFNWFIEGDFITSVPQLMGNAGFAIYVAALLLYVLKEVVLFKLTGFFNAPKNLLVVGTALSWWVGMVALNSDMAFTMTNVLTHGIPYMALVWLYHHHDQHYRQERHNQSEEMKSEPRFYGLIRLAISYVPLFVLLLWLLAYLEEGLWDGLVWREHLTLFLPFSHLPAITDTTVLAILIPLLALPQSTHYLLDGFIWRVKERSSIWSA